MNTATGLDFFVSFVDLTVIVVAISMLSYALYRGKLRYRESLASGGVLIACGLIIIVYAHLSDLVYQFIPNSGSASEAGFTSTFYSTAWYDWILSRAAFALIAIGFVISVLSRRRTENHLRSSMNEIEDLRLVGDEADQRFRYLFDNTSNSVFCYEYNPPMPIDLPAEEQIERSLGATLCHCNPSFAEDMNVSHPQDILGQRIGLLDRGVDFEAYSKHFTTFIENDYRLRDYAHNYRTADGRQKSLSVNITGVVNDRLLERVWVVETNVSALRETEVALERRQTFLELVAWVSSELVTAPDDRADELVEECLGEICGYFEADRSVIFWIGDEDPSVATSASIDYLWSTQGNPFGSTISLELYPKFMALLAAGKPVRIDDVSAMSEDFKGERKQLEKLGVKASMILPMTVADKIVGGLTVGRFRAHVPWSDDDEQDMIVLSELLANFVSRHRSHRALNNALLGLQRATDRLEAENVYLRGEVEPRQGFEEIVGNSNAILRCLQLVEQVAGTTTPVLILGETGTGKELIARAIHDLSDRGKRPLVKVNCAALPANLIESELFGHEKGAFTGADNAKRGRFDLANGSTLFLDELGEIPIELQAKLLRVLQEGEFERLGGTKTVKVDVRILVATNRDLGVAVQEGEFRSDLYYRINTFPIELPALRDRGGDIDLLVEHFVNIHASRLDRDVQEISAETMRQLRAYSWPGNVRELEGIIQRALISSSGQILELADPLISPTFDDGIPKIVSSSIADLKLVERDHILSVLENTNWKISGKSGAASQLGVPPSTLRSKMKKLRISRPG